MSFSDLLLSWDEVPPPLWGCESLLIQLFPPGALTIPAPLWSSHHRELSYTGKRVDWTQGHLACGPFGLEHSFFLALCRILTILDSHLDATPLEDSISPQPQKLFEL